ncbi:ABC transporter ATP-binding protein [Daejeonella lutea]|uniref:ABC-type multidrug transport system, ATPase and permease component n=1 Tax=Daejeonella lutea TaxID=572036 RepID=A0A1T5AIC2_9SPHI|nr:ABC transporter transmembrane domain-containing protein [Daejeonella lutea]SKB34579.1 ABC-type multidrug transport system, ATPase and permease component [Daejeonella lutea]
MARARLNSGNAQAEELPKAKINKESIRQVMKLLSYLKPYRTKFFLGLICLIVSSGSSFLFPLLMGRLIGTGAPAKPTGAIMPREILDSFPTDINTVALTLLGVLFVQSIFSYFRINWFVEVAEKGLADIRRDTYHKLITLPMNFFSQRRVGELNSRLSADLSQIQDAITTTLAEMIRQVIIFTGGIIFLVLVSGKLTLMLLAVLPVMVVIAVVFGRFIRKLSRKAQDKLAESNTIVEETLQGISNVKAFVNEAYEVGRYNTSIREVVKIAMRGAKFRGIFASFIVFCLFGTIVSVVWYGSHLVQAGEISLASMFTFILLSTFVGAAMGSFPELYATMQKAFGASERVLEILGEQNEPISMHRENNKITQKINGDLQFKNVVFAYPSRKEITVLNGVSFEARRGEKVAIIGPSGAGKSTIAGLILRFYEAQEGSLLFDGRESSAYSLTDVRNQVAIVPQDVLLFGGTIRENIAYGRLNASEEEIIMAAKRANAHDFIAGFPESYNTLVGERGVKLSGGQRQRIAIARALLKDPAILILDEATSSLDSESERLVQEALEELMKNRTSIIIAHRLSTIREADKIVVLEKGKVIESGSHADLMKNKEGLYRYLSQLQLETTEK